MGWVAFCVLPRSKHLRQPGAWRARCPRWSVCLNHLPAPAALCPGCPTALLRGADLRLWSSWQMSTIQDLRKTWLAAGSLLTVWWRMSSQGWDCSSPLPAGSGCLKPASLPPGREGPVHSLLALLWYSLNPSFCEPARLCLRLLGWSLSREGSLFCSCS